MEIVGTALLTMPTEGCTVLSVPLIGLSPSQDKVDLLPYGKFPDVVLQTGFEG